LLAVFDCGKLLLAIGLTGLVEGFVKLRSKYWGTASEYLHFRGTHARSACDPGWIDDAIEHLSTPAKAMYEVLTTTMGTAAIRPSGMNPTTKMIWDDFREDRITLEQAKTRLEIVHP
jgi:hypothetical protein